MPYLLRDSRPTARKGHRCDTCDTAIETGTTYQRSTYLGDDGLYEWVTCLPCDRLMADVWEWADRPDDGVATEDYDEWAREHVDDEEHGEDARAFLARRLSLSPDPDLHAHCVTCHPDLATVPGESTLPSGEQRSEWRGMSNHNVRRMTPTGPVLAPCFCWATTQHDMGDELSSTPAEPSP